MLFPVQTPILVAFDLLLIGLIFLLLYPTFKKDTVPPQWQVFTAIACIVIFSMFSFWGPDWFHYQETFNKLHDYSNTSAHIEDVYIFLIRKICPHYFVFRAIVWGGGIIFISLIINHLGVNQPLAWFFFGVLFLPLYAYARVSLAIVMMLCGAVLIDKPLENKKIQSYMLGVGLIICSYFFHKSAIIGIGLIVFSFLIKDPKEYTWLLYILVFLVCVLIAQILIEKFMEANIQADDDIAKTGQNYLDSRRHTKEHGIGALIKMFLERMPYYLTAFLSYKILKNFQVPRGIHIILQFHLYAVLFASVFFFDLGANTSILFGRILRFTLVPSVIILCYARQYKLFPKLVNTVFSIAFAHTIYCISYSLYNSTFL